MPPTADHIELIVRGLIVCRGHVLICWSRKGEYGYLPGGHIEIGESAATALVREMEEETGLACRVGPLLLTHENRFSTSKRQHHELNLVLAAEITDRAFLRAGGKMCHVAHSSESSIAERQRGAKRSKGGVEGVSPPLVLSRESHLEFRWMTPKAMRRAKLFPQPMAHWAAGMVAGGLDSTEGLRTADAPQAEWLSTMGG